MNCGVLNECILTSNIQSKIYFSVNALSSVELSIHNEEKQLIILIRRYAVKVNILGEQ